MRLSIIIPAYNVDQYIGRCVESCESQDVHKNDYEIIIVNDGSRDNSLNIANALANKYSNVNVVSQENQGLSVARNTGMALAKGKYIWFVDSDDYVVKNCVGGVLTLCENNDLDICHFFLDHVYADGTIEKANRSISTKELLTGKEAILRGLDGPFSSACANIYKRCFLQENNLLFAKGLTQQDVEFNGRAFSVARRCLYVENSMYLYFFNTDSIRRSPKIEKQIKYAGDTVRVAASHLRFSANMCKDKELREYFVKHVNSRIAAGIVTMVKDGIDQRILCEFMKVAEDNGLYPMKGPFLSKKWILLRPIINHRSLWWLLRIIL